MPLTTGSLAKPSPALKKPKRYLSTKSRKPPASEAEKAHLAAVKGLPCVITGEYGVIAHHACHDRRGRGKWNAFSSIPLAQRLHDRMTPEGIHENKTTWREKFGADWSYIKETLEAIYGGNYSEDI